jgi:hypothetical protein
VRFASIALVATALAGCGGEDTSLSHFEAASLRVEDRACRGAGLSSARISEAQNITVKEER